MARHRSSLTPSYFDRLYAADADPWRFATSEYERAKYMATLSALPRERYEHGLEVGCSIGVLTRQLAPRCAALLAIDVSTHALNDARVRCADRPSVDFRQARVPHDWPDGTYDLILLSEVLYYLDRTDVAALASRLEKSSAAGADIVLVHWLGETDYPLGGDEAAVFFIDEATRFARIHHQARTEAYRLDVLRVDR